MAYPPAGTGNETVRPLSTAQRAFWDKQAADGDGDSSGIIVGLSIDIFAPVDPQQFRAAAQALLDQSDALRTSFSRSRGVLSQVVTHHVPVSFRAVDLSGPTESDESRQRVVEEWGHTPFDLAVPPLVDHLLVCVAPDHWTWHCRCHHLVIDASGAAVGVAAILEAYASLLAGAAPDLSYLRSYADFLDSDEAYVDSDRYRADLAYWLARHATPSERLFGPGQGAPQRVTPRQRVVNREQYERLLEACRVNDVQPFHAFVSALGALAYRMFDRSTLSLGLATHNRTTEAERHTVGLLAGTMAFRLEIDPRETLAELARRASKQLRRDYRHARLPLNHLADAIGVARTPLFDLALSFQPASFEMDVGGARVRLRSGIFAGTDTEPAAIHIRDPQGDSPLGVDLTHCPDLVSSNDAVRFYEAFVNLLERWPDMADTSVAELTLEA
ncbi:MAG TPA: condensation domain-containing protein [Gemmatimonadaceae bacterium]